MPAITLYQFPGDNGLSLSPFCNKVHWALRLKGLLYRTETVLSAGKVSASAKLPAMLYDGEKLLDSSVILRVLDERHPSPRLVPQSPHDAAQAMVLEEFGDKALMPLTSYLRWSDDEIVAAMALLTFPTLSPTLARAAMKIPRRARLKGNMELVRQGRPWVESQLEQHLDALEVLLQGRQWFVGDAISVADLGIAVQVHVLLWGPARKQHPRIEARPALHAWYQRVIEQTQAR